MTYFKEIRILIPPSWNDIYEGSEETTWETYSAADVLIRPYSGVMAKDQPYVRTYGACGTPGSYMLLSPEFISDQEGRLTYGRPQKVSAGFAYLIACLE